MKITLTEQETAISLIINPGNTTTFDPAGRVVGIYENRRYYSRGLDGDFKEKSWEGAQDEFDRHIKPVSAERKKTLLAQLVKDLETAKSHGGNVPLLDRLITKSKKLHSEEREFHSIYKPITILPPDQYFTIVIQITEGCPWNKCTYCDFYRHRPFRIRPLSEIKTHVAAVQSLLGEGHKLRRSIFLGDANSFAVPNRSLLPMIEIIRKSFPDQTGPEGGICTFGDVPAILGKHESDIAELKKAGLKRVYIGMESGSDEVRALINKPGSKADLLKAIHKLKQSKMEVGLIMMLGIGGKEFEKNHLKESISVFEQAPLQSSDIVFCSPFISQEHLEYDKKAKLIGLTPIDKNGFRHQYKLIKQSVQTRPRPPRIGVYDIREFVY